jgi:hypothetical protein
MALVKSVQTVIDLQISGIWMGRKIFSGSLTFFKAKYLYVPKIIPTFAPRNPKMV